VLAGGERLDRDRHVPVVGGRDQHCVHVLAREDFLVVARREDLLAEQLLRARQAAVVEIGHSNEFDARSLQRRLGVARALDAQADRGEANAIGGTRGRLRLFRLRLQQVHARRGHDRAGRGALQELTSRGLRSDGHASPHLFRMPTSYPASRRPQAAAHESESSGGRPQP
jgi:hypothetical protein